MPTYYVEDYDGKRADEAKREQIPLPDDKATEFEENAPQAKVVDEADERKPARRSSRAKTKG